MAWNSAILVLFTGWQTDKEIPGLQMAPTASKVSQIWNLVTRIHSSNRGMEIVRSTNGVDGKDVSKSECLPVMGKIEAYALA
jgi:hypothetical protein